MGEGRDMDHWSPSPTRYNRFERKPNGLFLPKSPAYTTPPQSPTSRVSSASRYDSHNRSRNSSPSSDHSKAPEPKSPAPNSVTGSPQPDGTRYNRFDRVTGSVYEPHGSTPFYDPFDDALTPEVPEAPKDEVGRPFITPFNPDPPFSAFQTVNLTKLVQRPPGGRMETRFLAGTFKVTGRNLQLTIPDHIPPRMSHRALPWFPPRCGFPPSVRIVNKDIRWSDVDIHVSYEMIKEHCYSPGLFEHTFMAVFSIPGLATKIASLDNCPGWFAASGWMCERLPPTRCMIKPEWGPGTARRLIRYLHYECAWSFHDFQTIVEPFVARRINNYFWNPCCNPGLKLPSPGEGSRDYDWFDRPWTRPDLPNISLDQYFGHEPLVTGDTNRFGKTVVRLSQPRSERALLDRLI
jgi:hypothetical protein